MEGVFEHLRQNLAVYAVVSVCIIPVLYIFRKHTVPVIFHGLEVLIYSVLAHLAFYGMVQFTWWFKSQSAMQLDANAQPYTTPLTAFWVKDLYSPEALYYVEVGMFFLIIFVVAYFRPLKMGVKNQYKGKQGPPPPKKKSAYNRRPARGQYARRR